MAEWSGLGMAYFSNSDIQVVLPELLDIQSNIGNNIRMDIPTYTNTTWLAYSKVAVIQAVAMGMNVVWGVSSNTPTTITAANWPDFHTAILDAAAWAQANGVYEFQLGNEEEIHNEDVDPDITDAEIRAAIKSTATEVQAIFTRGNVSYAATAGVGNMSAWNTLGLGDIDLLSFNLYLGNGSTKWYASPDSFKEQVAAMHGYFGDNAYITEFNLNATSIASFSTDGDIQARELAAMINYIRAQGVLRAYYFAYNSSSYNFSVRSDATTYRTLWNNLTTTNGRRWFV